MAFCRNCGAQLIEGSVFCNYCGTRDIPSAPIVQTVVQPAALEKPKKGGMGFAISSMIIGIIGMAYAFIFFVAGAAENGDFYAVFPFLMMTVGAMPLVATIFSYSAMHRGRTNGFSIAGLITGLIGCFFVALQMVLAFVSFLYNFA